MGTVDCPGRDLQRRCEMRFLELGLLLLLLLLKCEDRSSMLSGEFESWWTRRSSLVVATNLFACMVSGSALDSCLQDDPFVYLYNAI